MRTRLIARLSRTILACLLAATITLPAAAAELAPRKLAGNGVTVTVTPQNVSRDARFWEFKITLDTHSQELRDDLVKSAVLIAGAGVRHAPVAWEGAAPGGHHRDGVLRFKAPAGESRVIELQITRAGESAPRSFRWQLD